MTIVSKFGLVLAAAGVAMAATLVQRGEGWSKSELEVLQSLSLDALETLPADPSNRYADDPGAAAAFAKLPITHSHPAPGVTTRGASACQARNSSEVTRITSTPLGGSQVFIRAFQFLNLRISKSRNRNLFRG